MSDYLKQRQEWGKYGKPAKEKKVYSIPKVSEKRKKKMAEEAKSGDSKLDSWFEARRKEMVGKCALCGGKTEKANDETYRNSIHHIFEKRQNMFPSVSTHVDNWLEVCFYGNSCHANIHGGMITWELLHDSHEWKTIVEKFKKVFPYMLESEHKNIHPLLLKEL